MAVEDTTMCWTNQRPDNPSSAKLRFESQEERKKQSNILKKYYIDHPEARERQRENTLKYFKTEGAHEKHKKAHNLPETRKKHRDVIKKCFEDPEFRKKHADGIKKHYIDYPEAKLEIRKRTKSLHEDPEFRKKQSIGLKNRFKDPDFLKKFSAIQKTIHSTPELREKHSEATKKYFKMSGSREKLSEIQKKNYIDRCWFGNVTYYEPEKYCILFNKGFKERCRSFYGYKSVLSGIHEHEHFVNGKPEKLTVHHVYYQPKACCEWDKDIQGFYAMINLGTKKNPNIIRYDIHGDPNKFVTLTHGENATVNFDKLKWIKIFENEIEEHNGKCYYTKEEWELLNKSKKVSKI